MLSPFCSACKKDLCSWLCVLVRAQPYQEKRAAMMITCVVINLLFLIQSNTQTNDGYDVPSPIPARCPHSTRNQSLQLESSPRLKNNFRIWIHPIDLSFCLNINLFSKKIDRSSNLTMKNSLFILLILQRDVTSV